MILRLLYSSEQPANDDRYFFDEVLTARNCPLNRKTLNAC